MFKSLWFQSSKNLSEYSRFRSPRKDRMGKSLAGKCSPEVWFGIFISSILLVVLLTFDYPSTFLKVDYGVNLFEKKQTHPNNLFVKNQSISVIEKSTTDLCYGRYIYIHDDLPAKFNYDLTNNCESLTESINIPNMCPYIENFGFGRVINKSRGVLTSKKRWYSTNQFSLELIFHSKMKHYKCLTNNSAQASAIYIPIYPGLEDSKHLGDPNLTARDSFGKDFAKWVSSRPEWKKMWGRDHFFVSGRVSYDYRRQTDNSSDWGSKLMLLPESWNMTMLVIEGSSRTNDIAIPYPTGFHPAKDREVFQWQNKVRRQERPYLFTFVGGPRADQNSIRGKLFDQCQASNSCIVLNCRASGINCEDTATVMRVFQQSVYCLQPTGDTYTRKSAFDSILAGCIPVFFHPASFYNQYTWYLPRNYTRYSVFIPVRTLEDLKDVSIEKILLGISKDREFAMREQVISLIPTLVYGDPRSRLETKDAFDIAVDKVIARIENVRKVTREGRDPSIGFAEEDGNKFLFPKELQ